MLAFASSILLGALLLFLVQPLAGKQILPWFGGGANVWATCLLFFQTLLLAGYAYAHWLGQLRSTVAQRAIHGVLLLVSFAFLPIAPSQAPKTALVAPAWGVLWALGSSLLLPYLLLSSTGPLLQRWFALAEPARSPYRLFALSNAGSLVGLLGYPLLLEPWLGLTDQSRGWSAVYVVYAGAVMFAARGLPPRLPELPAPAQVAPFSRRQALTWIALAAVGSQLLVAATTQLTKDVAPIPFLWVTPLSVYLLSFIFVFHNDHAYRAALWRPLLLVGVALSALWVQFTLPGFELNLAASLVLLWLGTVVCHGELALRVPAPARLTAFYLCVATGGALGGLVGALVVPVLLDHYWDVHLSLLTLAGVLALVWAPRRRQLIGAAVGFTGLCLALGYDVIRRSHSNLYAERNFYGVVAVKELDAGGERARRWLVHGHVIHGGQFSSEARALEGLLHYDDASGPAIALRAHAKRSQGEPLTIGVVGLGVGAVAPFARAGDVLVFYEINPAVVHAAQQYFTYLDRSAARVELVVGDARLELERELAAGRARGFDVLVLDAFNSDAVPVHLVTHEAFATYFAQLQADGLLVINIATSHLDLTPLLAGLADAHQRKMLKTTTPSDPARFLVAGEWVLMGTPRALEAIESAHSRWEAAPSRRTVWTDDYSNVLGLVR